MMVDSAAMVKYLRASCVRALSSTQTQRSVKRGELLSLDLGVLAASIDEEKIKKYQKRIMGSEQGILISEAKKFVFMICNPETSENKYTDQLTALSLNEGIKYYLDLYRKLPRIESEKDLPKLSEVSFVKDSQGRIIGEFSKNEVNESLRVVRKNRRKLPDGSIPAIIKKALVSIEDARFWNFESKSSPKYKGHLGVDFKGLMRAMISSGNGNLQGGSTITMQLAKNLLLYKDVFSEHEQGKRSLLRKLKEYILVKRLEDSLTKDQILDWYLNTIDFGRRSQGVVMAAQSYFGKDLEVLKIEEAAFLAALPKAPNSLDPEENFEEALKRRNKVINRMKSEKYISASEKKSAKKETIKFIPKQVESKDQGYASFYISAVEKQLKDWLSANDKDKSLAFDIETPINHQYQKWAVESLQRGLLKIERSKGTLVIKPDQEQLPNIQDAVVKLAFERNEKDLNKVFVDVLSKVRNPYPDGAQFKIAVVLSGSSFGLKDGSIVKRSSKDKKRYKRIGKDKTLLSKWDVVLLQPFMSKEGITYRVASYTDVQGAIVVIENSTGAVLATSGGFSVGAGRRYQGISGNNAFYAKRQPGSTVKPFSYFSAMMNGLMPTTIVSNKNIKLPRRKVNGEKICNSWSLSSSRSEASSYTLRQGLEKSKNRLTVNAFLSSLGIGVGKNYSEFSDILGKGIDLVLDRMQKFGLYKNLKHACYPILLGANELKVVDLAGAYATIANEGVYREPYVLKSVKREGVVSNPFKPSQLASALQIEAIAQDSNKKFNLFRVRTFMQGVVERGTAKSMKDWHKIVAGKTGTTNKNKDAWFAGFNKDITVVVWVGYPRGRSLGSKYDGSTAALPIFKDFMSQYYKAYPKKLKNEFYSKPANTVAAIIEPNTGFYIDKIFQSDFEHYTGKKSKIKGVVEYFQNKNELSKSVYKYKPGSLISGEFFFKNLSREYRRHYKKGYDLKVKEVKKDLFYDKQDLKAQDDYCRANKRKFPDHHYVINACAEAKIIKERITSLKELVKSFKNYYLYSLGFY